MVFSRNNMIGCEDERRSGILSDPAHPLNGIDYVEFRRNLLAPPAQRYRLEVTFLKPPPAAPAISAADIEILGGVRVIGIRVLDVQPDPGEPNRLRVFLDQEGDFSSYVLRIEHAELDSERSEARFGFKTGCPTEFDCRVETDCPPEVVEEPALDYMAKDYQSFRRMLVDFIAQRNPGWQERLPADLGMALVELLSYTGDMLSYFQDAGPGTEGYLDTCLHRLSARRHALLIDYRMHNGRNAVTHVHFRATAGTDGVVPPGAKLVTHITVPLIGETAPPGPIIPVEADFDNDPALVPSTVFETTALTRVTSLHNELRLHTWSDTLCCLAQGATEAHLFALTGAAGNEVAVRTEFEAGDYLLLEEVLSPVTGVAADRDAAHRQVVRIVSVEDTEDAAFTSDVPGGGLTPRHNPADPALPLQRVVWREEDGLGFALCLSAETDDGVPIGPVSVARGNVAPADHGRTLNRDSDDDALGLPFAPSIRTLPVLPLPEAPLTHQAMPESPLYTDAGRLIPGRHDLEVPPYEAAPAVALILTGSDGDEELWTPVPHLLDSGPYDRHFVAESDNNGQAILRFGDDQYGRRPLGTSRARARFRIGNGVSGNIGRESLVHVVEPDPTEALDPANPGAPLVFADVAAVYQPLSARLGAAEETIEQVRQNAPEAFRAIQFRAVTVEDWEEVALRHAGVAAAKVRFRWTGSWHTVFVAIHPKDEDALVRLPGGGVTLAVEFAAEMKAHLTRFKLAGYDLKVRAATYVPLEIEIQLCVARGHFRGDILQEVSRRLSNKQFADGSRGFFHPLEFQFGEAVYLSRLYAAIAEVQGVESSTVQVFKRYWEAANDELEHGRIPMGPFEIPRLDNDPNFPENGVLRLTAVGGQ